MTVAALPVMEEAAGARAAAGAGDVASKKSATVVGGNVSTDVPSPPKVPSSGGGGKKYGVDVPDIGGGKSSSGSGKSLGKALSGGGNGNRVLVAEFLLCMTILAFSPMTDKHKSEGPVEFMKRGAAICALFFILGLVSSGGPKAAKVAAGFGGIVTLALAVSSRDVFTVLASRFNASSAGATATGDDLDLDGDGVPNYDLIEPLNGGLPDGSGIASGHDTTGINPSGSSNGQNMGGLGPGGVAF